MYQPTAPCWNRLLETFSPNIETLVNDRNRAMMEITAPTSVTIAA